MGETPAVQRRHGKRRGHAAIALSATAAAVALGLAVPASAATGSGLPRASGGASNGHGALHYARMQPLCRAAKLGDSSCLALRRVDVPKGTAGAVPYRTVVGAHGPHNGYSPADLAKVYRLVIAANTTATVAVVDAYNSPRIRHELNQFDRQYGLPTETKQSLQVVNQSGGSTLPKTNWGWAVETALDVQAVRGMCNKCRILLVEAKNASNGNLAKAENTAVRLGADVVSNSYGGPEAGASATIRAAYRHHGVVITAATGDDGWYDWDFVNQGGYSDNQPNVPASLPSVVAVGGTTLTLNADGSRASETVWNGDGPHNSVGWAKAEQNVYPGASGGGCSTHFRAPAWQASVAGYEKTGCGTRRLSGDISAVGDPATGYSVFAPSQNDPSRDAWQVIGGTSLSAPLVAGMYGLVGGANGVPYPAESIYLNYKYHPYWAYDVRSGGNGFCGGDNTTDCSAGVRALSPLVDTDNPNNLEYGDQDPVGKLDCSYSYHPKNPDEKTVANNTQCNAAKGYDGPSGVGTPNMVRLLRSAFPSVKIRTPNNVHAGHLQHYRAVHFTDTIAKLTGYVWRWHDGSKATIRKRVTLVTHRFTEPGKHRITLTAHDSLHRQVSVSVVVDVR
jgi:subtilase family serine protease